MANKWWEHYGMQEVVLIEDLDKSHHVLGHHLKLWADKYPFRGEIKTNSLMARPKTICVTSNYHPSEIWSDSGMLEPILRRFCIVKFPLAPGFKFLPDKWPVQEGIVDVPSTPPVTPPSTLPIVTDEGEFFCDTAPGDHLWSQCPSCSMAIYDPEDHLRTCPNYPKITMRAPMKKRKPMD
jgi:hypothetical protein